MRPQRFCKIIFCKKKRKKNGNIIRPFNGALNTRSSDPAKHQSHIHKFIKIIVQYLSPMEGKSILGFERESERRTSKRVTGAVKVHEWNGGP